MMRGGTCAEHLIFFYNGLCLYFISFSRNRGFICSRYLLIYFYHHWYVQEIHRVSDRQKVRSTPFHQTVLSAPATAVQLSLRSASP